MDAICQFPAANINTILDSLLDLADGGGGAGKLRIYTGTKPATSAGATGTKLAELTMSSPAWAAASGKSKAAHAITNANALASGDAGYFRVVDSAGNLIVQGDVGQTGDTAALILVTKTIVSGQPVEVDSLTVGGG